MLQKKENLRTLPEAIIKKTEQEKKSLTTDDYVFNPNDIISETEDGYVVRHGDHFHYIFKKDIPVKSSPIINSNPMQSSFEVEDNYVFNPMDIVKEYPHGYVVRHGDHFHFIPKNDFQKSVNDTSENVAVVSRPINNSTFDISTTNKITNDGYHFNPKDIVDETKDGYVVKHNDHYHFIFKNSQKKTYSINKNHEKITNNKKINKQNATISKNKKMATLKNERKNKHFIMNKEIETKIRYLSTIYDVPFNQFKLDGDKVIYPHLDHYHVIYLKDIIIPEKSKNLEEEFENELNALAKSMQVDPETIIIENGFMKIVHGDHTHDYKIKSMGWKDYLKNRIPNIETPGIPGNLDRQIVKDKIDSILKKAENKFGSKSRYLLRVKRVLQALEEKTLGWGVDSTEGFIQALNNFEKKYVDEKMITENDKGADQSSLPDKTKLNNIEERFAKLSEQIGKIENGYFSYIECLTQIKTDYFNGNNGTLVEDRLTLLENDVKEKLSKSKEQVQYETNWSNVYQQVTSLDENLYLNEKIKLLNALDDIKTKQDNSKLKEIEATLFNLLNRNTPTKIVSTDETVTIDELKSQLQSLIYSIDEVKYLIKRVEYLNKYYELMNSNDISAIQSLINEVNNFLTINNQNDDNKQKDTIPQMFSNVENAVNEVKPKSNSTEQANTNIENSNLNTDDEKINTLDKEKKNIDRDNVEKENNATKKVNDIDLSHLDTSIQPEETNINGKNLVNTIE
ncbi:MAG: pneumococcal-type histidine triad protein [Enterococcus faecalis]|nr:pneumococcal-type histidine triad protein [Enterococcus faecalis]